MKDSSHEKNTFEDLHNLMMDRIRRLCDESLDDEQLLQEISRSNSVALMAGKMVDNGRLVLDSQKFLSDPGRTANGRAPRTPRMLDCSESE